MDEYRQLSLFDIVEPPKKEKVFSPKCSSCIYQIWLRPKNKGVVQGCDHYDGCEYQRRNCHHCAYYGEVVDAYTCERLGYKTCFNNDAKFNNGIGNVNPDEGCEYWLRGYGL